ncbi:MAG: OadG family protein [Gluconobacter japonicus]|uniref:OadG family protein n=1 Tax=Gluconobacter japonicus TaxID=376620 RepID=UPI0039E8F022
MLIVFLILLCLVLWTSIYALYFRKEITAWLVNRFEKDKPRASDEPPEPIRYKPRPEEKVDG